MNQILLTIATLCAPTTDSTYKDKIICQTQMIQCMKGTKSEEKALRAGYQENQLAECYVKVHKE